MEASDCHLPPSGSIRGGHQALQDTWRSPGQGTQCMEGAGHPQHHPCSQGMALLQDQGGRSCQRASAQHRPWSQSTWGREGSSSPAFVGGWASSLWKDGPCPHGRMDFVPMEEWALSPWEDGLCPCGRTGSVPMEGLGSSPWKDGHCPCGWMGSVPMGGWAVSLWEDGLCPPSPQQQQQL